MAQLLSRLWGLSYWLKCDLSVTSNTCGAHTWSLDGHGHCGLLLAVRIWRALLSRKCHNRLHHSRLGISDLINILRGKHVANS